MESGKSVKSGKSGLDLVPGFGAVGEIYYKFFKKVELKYERKTKKYLQVLKIYISIYTIRR